jgi:hypothetical protein
MADKPLALQRCERHICRCCCSKPTSLYWTLELVDPESTTRCTALLSRHSSA